ncbi:uncharacterized protein F4812DRAFT_88213 [Daldinia caldariorum]|uniref:uncharacterized protein n=1 Tax=Daldinia caldariorum TaxID=326644 RepID=UPI002007AB03|nr:uncharacterized protein F4812DRAFT_88213 [Daldinia caldariorum]KAI1465911.1 hypothetical protein F4812DRAFT_88213 [Daldinia caldariorum]
MAPTGGQRSGTENRTGSNVDSSISSDRQVAASNSTLNAWVGRRQPSWLTNAKPVKPSPRLPQPPTPKQPITTETVRPIVETIQPVSVSVPISNTPEATSAPPRQPRRPQHSPDPLPFQTTQTRIQQPQTSISAARTVLPSPAPSDEPSPGATKPQSMPAVIGPRLTLDSALDDPMVQSRVPTPRLQTILQQSREISLSPRASTPANMSINTPPTPSLPSNLTPLEHPEIPPAKRQRLSFPGLQFLIECRATTVLQHRIQYIGGMQNLDPIVERPRYQLLLESFESGDLFFVVLHQIFCIWSRNRMQAHELCKNKGRNPEEMDKGFGNLETVLKSNIKLNPDHIIFLSEFPVALNKLLGNAQYQTALGEVLEFLRRMALNWHRVLTDHRMKGYPFLLGELLDEFSLHSPILQGIMFRASRRSMGGGDGPAAKRMEILFKSDQDYHRNNPHDFFTKPRPIRYSAHIEYLISTYRSILGSEHNWQNSLAGQQSQQSQLPQLAGPPNIQQPNQYSHPNPHMGPYTNSHFVPYANTQMDGQITPPAIPQGNLPVNPQMSIQINRQLNRQVSGQHVGSPTGYLIHPQMRHNFHQAPQYLPQATNSFVQNAMPTTVPPSYILSSTSITANDATATAPLQPNPNFQRVMQHQAAGRLPQQDYYMMPESPRPIPASTNTPGGQSHEAHIIGQRPQSLHRFGSQSALRYPSCPSPGNLIPSYGNFNRTSSAPMTSQARFSADQLRNPTHTHSLPGPMVQNKTQLAGLERLIPAPGMAIDRRDYPYTQYDRNSMMMSLHQVRLRSPKRMPREEDPEKLGRYYQAVKEFALLPVAIPPQLHLHQFDFDVPNHQFLRMVKEETKPGEHLPVSLFSSRSLRLRLRCCYMKKTHTPATDAWVTTETTWPPHIFLELNNHTLSIPRKSHHSKDIPIEAASAAVADKNVLKVSVPKMSGNKEPKPRPGWEFYIAVELIEILSHRDVLQMVQMRGRVPAESTREAIKKRLLRAKEISPQNEDEDELVMVDELSIDLIDPFSRTMFKVPVRGRSCTHLECFDLETWLNSRLGKKSCNSCNNVSGGCHKCPNEPSFVDKWKCPLCFRDARPYNLIIDGFLVEVRSQLERQNLLKTKSILVSPDGTWKPKTEPADDDDNLDSEDEINEADRKFPKTNQRKEPEIEVIEID